MLFTIVITFQSINVLLYFWSDKISLGEHKRLLSKTYFFFDQSKTLIREIDRKSIGKKSNLSSGQVIHMFVQLIMNLTRLFIKLISAPLPYRGHMNKFTITFQYALNKPVSCANLNPLHYHSATASMPSAKVFFIFFAICYCH